MNLISLKSDFKMIFREPILVLLLILPLFIFIIFKLLSIFAFSTIQEYTGIDLFNYKEYILALTLLFTPLMLGTVTGFIMIDDRDARIFELISVTPVGYMGYIINRISLSFFTSIIYSFIGYFIINIYQINFLLLFFIALLTGIEASIIGFILFLLAEDKVKGLTYAKSFGLFNLLALSDVIGIKWLSLIAATTPFYWITKLITCPNIGTIILSLVVHLFWLYIIYSVNNMSN